MNYDYNNYQNQIKSVEAVYTTDVARRFILNVYNWMALGLVLTGTVAYGLSKTDFIYTITPGIFWTIAIIQIIVVLALTFAINRIPSYVAILAFMFYSALTGVTFSILFLVYTGASIAYTFFICAGMFASVSIFGYVTKKDLSGMGTFLFMGLIGLIIASIVNMIFFKSETIYWIMTYAGVIIFTGLAAYDTQRIKKMSQTMDYSTEEGKKGAIIGALMLYLDFINLFLFLLRIFGERR